MQAIAGADLSEMATLTTAEAYVQHIPVLQLWNHR